jgi:CelD/BcsL family acetyltransferase involved in cellulose biosynthesis
MRKALARARRRGALDLEVHHPTTRDEIEPLLRQIFEIEDRCWKGEAGTSVLKTPGMLGFFVNQAELLAGWGQLEILLLKMSGEPIAFEYGLVGKGTYFSPKVGYDERFNDLSPGQLLRACYYERLHAEGRISEIDFLGPLTSATAKWASSDYTVGRLLIARDRLISRTAVAGYLRLRPLVRWIKAKRNGSASGDSSSPAESPPTPQRESNIDRVGAEVEQESLEAALH